MSKCTKREIATAVIGFVIWLSLLSIPFVYYGTHKTEDATKKEFTADIKYVNGSGNDTTVTIKGTVVEKRISETKSKHKDGKK